MIYSIENDFLHVSIDSFGAQPQSIRSKKTGVEYLWQGDKAYWGGRAYNLFPTIGRMFDGKYTYQGQTYAIRPHGLARYYEFELTAHSENELVFTLTHESAEDIPSQFPFRFRFSVRFALQGNTLVFGFSAKNLDDERDLICSFGGHPGINVPFDGGKFEDYAIQFEQPATLTQHLLSENKFIDGSVATYQPVDGVRIPLRHELFDNDALIFSGSGSSVLLKKQGGNRYVRMRYDGFQYFAIWHAVGTDAPFLCLEPWQSLCATEGKIDDLESKPDMLHVPPLETANAEFSLEFVE